MSLTGAQKRFLRGLGHSLHPVVQVGQHGVSRGVILATREALRQHELIKISVGRDGPVDRKTAPGLLADGCGAHVAQVIGRTALLYRRRHDDPAIALPGVFEEGPRPGPDDGDEGDA
ncbi:MAG: YhbY family RNA-binding protein [Myxococcales bacterium]|nr:YhbY family RNA-binding protein [Myxococcales bacterium]MCB9523141.1 YhbY family RNA-binding protein [Myxococcales bacterium]